VKFYRLNEIPIQSDDLVFKASPVRRLIPFVVFLAIFIVPFALALVKGKDFVLSLLPLPIFLCCIIEATFLLFAWLAYREYRASLRSTNWLLRCNDSGVIIKYRSFLNWRLPSQDIQAVGFAYSEIAWVKTVKEQRISPSTNERGDPAKQTQRLVYLDFRLVDTDTSALETHLRANLSTKPSGVMVTLDNLVQVLPGGIVQLRWNGLVPSVDKAIAYLGRHVSIGEAESTKLDLTRQRNASPEEENAKIVKLVKGGDKMGAVTLARQIYGYNLSEAVAFVERLQSGD
jgi:hypothetical protein